ncbi:MAG: TraB domain-containing protein [Spirochaetota bacterium]
MVLYIQLKNKEIFLLGTAHVSKDSVLEVEKSITEIKPGRVCVEIDASRYASMTENRSWNTLNIYQVIKEKKGFLLLANLVLSSFQRKLGAELGTMPGEEMMKAIEVATALNIPYSFADREVHVTLRRAWAKSDLWHKGKLLVMLLGAVFVREKFSREQLEKLKQKGALEDMMEELAKYLPAVKEVLIDERDRYLATKIFNTEENVIVAVVGAGHAPGISHWLKRLDRGEAVNNLTELDRIPPPSRITKVLPWIIPVIVLLCFP